MDGMDDMGGAGGTGFTPLSSDGVDFSNDTQAFNFLQQILDDSYFQVESNAYARYFWYAVAAAIVVASSVGILQRLVLRYGNKIPNMITSPFNTIVAIGRECSTIQLTPKALDPWFRVPPIGSITLVLTYFGLIIALEFANNDYPGAQHHQAYGLRAAWLAVAQVPLVILLAGKRNIIGLLTGVNYQRLNVLHRWIARGLLVLATMHFGFQSTGWNEYGLMQLEWRTDTCPPTGIAAYAILLWMNIANLSPFRHLHYSFFVVQHILMFFGFIIALMIHLPSTALYSRVYIWIAIGFFVAERLVRTVYSTWMNRSFSEARLENLDGVATRITVRSKAVTHWPAGSHIRLALPRFGFLMTHPATIVSTPKSHNGDLVFILKAHKGFTASLLKSALQEGAAVSRSELPAPTPALKAPVAHKCIIDGPYASSQLNLNVFEVVAFVAGGTGITFTLANLLSLSDRASSGERIPKHIDFTWIAKHRSYLEWVRDELTCALQKLKNHGCEVTCTIYVTRQRDELSSSDGEISADDAVVKLSTPPAQRGSEKMLSSSITVPDVKVQYGRPDVETVLLESIVKAVNGETAVAACGPLELMKAVRNQYTRICDDRAVCKGTGAQVQTIHTDPGDAVDQGKAALSLAAKALQQESEERELLHANLARMKLMAESILDEANVFHCDEHSVSYDTAVGPPRKRELAPDSSRKARNMVRYLNTDNKLEHGVWAMVGTYGIAEQLAVLEEHAVISAIESLLPPAQDLKWVDVSCMMEDRKLLLRYCRPDDLAQAWFALDTGMVDFLRKAASAGQAIPCFHSHSLKL